MATETDADRLTLLSTDDFAVTATIGGASVVGILDNEFYSVDMAGVEVESNQPQFLCRTSDVASLEYGSAVTIAGMSYSVISIEPDGTGMTLIRMIETGAAQTAGAFSSGFSTGFA